MNIPTTLGEVTIITTGKLDANAQDLDGKYPFFTCGEENLRINIAAFNTEAVLLAGNGNFSVKYYKGEFNAYQRTYVIEPNQIDGKWLYYLVMHHIAKITAGARGSTIKYLRIGDITDCLVNLVSIPQQKRIVTKLEELFSELDSGIASLKTAQEKLKIYRQAVLKHAFEGKLTAQWREENKMNPWQKITVKDLAILGPSNGKSVKDQVNGFPVLRLTALKNGKIDLSETKEGAWTKDEAESYLVNDGDFLFSRGNGSKHLVGRGGLVSGSKIKVAFPDTIMRIRLDKTKIVPSYFSYVWESRIIRDQIENAARTTAGIYKINQQHVKSFTIPIPSITEQIKITNSIEEILSVIDVLMIDVVQQLTKAEILRQSILKKAFSGQLVPQDPNDEPASELLARIQAEKAAALAKPKPAPVKRDRKAKETANG